MVATANRAQRTKEPFQVSLAAEIKEVKAFKSASLDKIYRMVLISDDSSMMALSVLDPDVMVKVTVEIIDYGS